MSEKKMIVWTQNVELSPLTQQPVVKVSPVEGDVCEVLGFFLYVKSGEYEFLFPATSIVRVDHPVFPEVEEEVEHEG
jgi:hypothetical protein